MNKKNLRETFRNLGWSKYYRILYKKQKITSMDMKYRANIREGAVEETYTIVLKKIPTNVWQQAMVLKVQDRFTRTIPDIRVAIFDCLRKSSVVETIRTVS